jgi:hypothetical protein
MDPADVLLSLGAVVAAAAVGVVLSSWATRRRLTPAERAADARVAEAEIDRAWDDIGTYGVGLQWLERFSFTLQGGRVQLAATFLCAASGVLLVAAWHLEEGFARSLAIDLGAAPALVTALILTATTRRTRRAAVPLLAVAALVAAAGSQLSGFAQALAGTACADVVLFVLLDSWASARLEHAFAAYERVRDEFDAAARRAAASGTARDQAREPARRKACQFCYDHAEEGDA